MLDKVLALFIILFLLVILISLIKNSKVWLPVTNSLQLATKLNAINCKNEWYDWNKLKQNIS